MHLLFFWTGYSWIRSGCRLYTHLTQRTPTVLWLQEFWRRPRVGHLKLLQLICDAQKLWYSAFLLLFWYKFHSFKRPQTLNKKVVCLGFVCYCFLGRPSTPPPSFGSIRYFNVGGKLPSVLSWNNSNCNTCNNCNSIVPWLMFHFLVDKVEQKIKYSACSLVSHVHVSCKAQNAKAAESVSYSILEPGLYSEFHSL